VGSDEEKNKMTYPALYGVESSREKAEELIEQALGHLAGFPEKAEPLREIARYIARRSH
jgi:geranylgeranyl diphosphate synthase type II